MVPIVPKFIFLSKNHPKGEGADGCRTQDGGAGKGTERERGQSGAGEVGSGGRG